MTYCDNPEPHTIKFCPPCRRGYRRERARQLGVQPRQVKEPAPEWKPTRLNLRTTRKYEACQERGGCVASDDWIERMGAYVPICKRCAVPLMKLASGSPWRTWTGEVA